MVLVFFLCGLWHGASWNFVIWGLFHGAFLVVERLLARGGGRKDASHRRAGDLPLSRGPDASGALIRSGLLHAYTMLVVMVGWVFFRADTLGGAIAFLKAMAGLSPAAPTPFGVQWYLTPELWLALAAGVVGSTP